LQDSAAPTRRRPAPEADHIFDRIFASDLRAPDSSTTWVRKIPDRGHANRYLAALLFARESWHRSANRIALANRRSPQYPASSSREDFPLQFHGGSMNMAVVGR